LIQDRAHRAGKLQEVFGTGTAAVASPFGELAWEEDSIRPPQGPGLGAALREELVAIQRGEKADPHGWIEEV
jgi:branched-chain amino acid aminotransferase